MENSIEVGREKEKSKRASSRKERKERRERKKRRNGELDVSVESNNESSAYNGAENAESQNAGEISGQQPSDTNPPTDQLISSVINSSMRTPSPAPKKEERIRKDPRITSSSGRAFASNPAIQIYRPRDSIVKIQSLMKYSTNNNDIVNGENNLEENIQNLENKNNNNNNNKDEKEENKENKENDNNNNNKEIIVEEETEEMKEINRLKEELIIAMNENDIKKLTNFLEQLKNKIPEGNLNFRYNDGLTLIHKAIKNKSSKEILKNLVENGVSVHIPSITGLSPLHFASQIGDIQSVEFLLINKANAMQRDIENRTCLHLAVEGGNLSCVELLSKQSGVLINHRDNSGSSALHLAVKLEHKEIVDYLLNKGADPLLNDQSGNRAIDLIPGYSRFLSAKNIKLSSQGKKILKLLKKKGGHKLPVVNTRSDVILGGGLARSRSLDHRNPAVSSDFVKNLQNKGIQLNVNNNINNNNNNNNSNNNLNRISSYNSNTSGSSNNNNNNNNNLNLNQLTTNNSSSSPSSSSSSSLLSTSINLLDKKEIEKKEADLQLLYYAPSERSKVEENSSSPLPQTPVKKTDKYGFYTSQKSDLSDSKHFVKEEKLALKWLEITKNWDDAKKNKKLQKYADKGIPDSVRGLVWKLLAGCNAELPTDISYEELLQRDSIPKVKEQILKDITRTMPNHILFQEKGQGQQMLTNVLTAYSVYKPSVGYCQGMGFITAMFLMYMPEEDAFWMLDRIADEYRFAGLWEEKMYLVTQCMYTLGVLIQNFIPDVHAKLEEHNIPPISYVPQFFMTGFLYTLPFAMVVRIWDSFLLRKFDYLYAIAISLFKVARDKIAKMRMEQFVMFLKFKDSGEELDFTTDKLLKSAEKIWNKLNPSQIRKLEEDGGRIMAAEKEKILNERSAKNNNNNI